MVEYWTLYHHTWHIRTSVQIGLNQISAKRMKYHQGMNKGNAHTSLMYVYIYICILSNAQTVYCVPLTQTYAATSLPIPSTTTTTKQTNNHNFLPLPHAAGPTRLGSLLSKTT